MKIDYVSLKEKVFQLTYVGEHIIEDYVFDTREIIKQGDPIYRKKHWWSLKKSFIDFEKESITMTGWYRKSWKIEENHRPVATTDNEMIEFLRTTIFSADYDMGKHFYIDKENVIHVCPSIKFMLLGTDGRIGTRTLIYVYSYETEEEAMNAIERIKSVNPNLSLTYQEEN